MGIYEAKKALESLEYAGLSEFQKIERKEKKMAYRKQMVKDTYKLLTGIEMTDAEFLLYNEKFESPKTEKGWNIKNWIEDNKPRKE